MNDLIPEWDGKENYLHEFELQGRRCLIRDNKIGFLCGYVEIHEQEIAAARNLNNEDYDSDYCDFEVHGGITWQDDHISGLKAQEDCMIIGFDCGHVGDSSHPASGYTYKYLDGRYRNESFVFNEIRFLVNQIEALHEQQPCLRPPVIVEALEEMLALESGEE